MRWAEEVAKRYCTSQVACDGVPIAKNIPKSVCGACARKIKQREKAKQAQVLRGANTRG